MVPLSKTNNFYWASIYKTVGVLLLQWLEVSLRRFAIASIADNDAKNPDIDTKEEKRGQEQARHKCRQTKKFQVVPLRKPKCL